MARVARLSSVELDIFLTSASPDQQAIVKTLRDIISQRAGDLAVAVRIGVGSHTQAALREEPPIPLAACT